MSDRVEFKQHSAYAQTFDLKYKPLNSSIILIVFSNKQLGSSRKVVLFIMG